MQLRHFVLVVGIEPSKIGGAEERVHAACSQLRDRSFRTTVVWEAAPAAIVRDLFSDLKSTTVFHSIQRQAELTPRKAVEWLRFMRKARPSIVAYSFNGVLSCVPFAAWLGGARRVVYSHHSSSPMDGVAPQMTIPKRLIGRLLLAPLVGATAVSEFSRRSLVSGGLVPEGRTTTVYNGVDCSRPTNHKQGEQFRRRFSIPLHREVVLQVSWLVPEKGIDVLIRAMRRVLEKRPEAHLVVVGSGPQREGYQALAAAEGLTGHVTFTGQIERPRSEGVFEAASVYCQLSQWGEAFGLAIAEAMASGLPVVAANVGGIPELVDVGTTGYLVHPQDHTEASNRIVSLLNNHELRKNLGEAGQRRARDQFELRRNTAQLVECWLGCHPT
jgi:glycosyltransferase involved in cell wall biosynthesis